MSTGSINMRERLTELRETFKFANLFKDMIKKIQTNNQMNRYIGQTLGDSQMLEHLHPPGVRHPPGM